MLLLAIAIPVAYYTVPGSHPFEGRFSVSQLSFTYNGSTNTPLLNSIPKLGAIDLETRAPQPLTLTGQFTSDILPQLSQRDRITFQAKRIVIEPPKNSQLSLIALQIAPETRIEPLIYSPEGHKLSACLVVDDTPSDDIPPPNCSNLVNLPGIPSKPVGTIGWLSGSGTLTLILEDCEFTQPELPPQPYVEVQFTPQSNPEKQLQLFSPTRIAIALPPSEDSSQMRGWLRSNLDVADLRFTQLDRTGNVRDDLPLSTIRKGRARLGSQQLEVQAQQFFIVRSREKGIHKLNFLEIQDEEPKGIAASVSGEASSIAVGLNPDFPVEQIQPHWLSRYFPPEAIATLFALLVSATVSFLLPRSFPEKKD